MTTLDFLKKQVIETRSFTKRMISEMPEDLWYEIPENTNSNFAWQIGHIFLAQNYHIISCAFGREPRIFEKIPVQSFAKVFGGLGSIQRFVDKDFVSTSELKDNFDFVFDLCIQKLETANDDILSENLEPTPFKNPIAKNKYDAISWSFKHEMWHCAEMEQIKIKLGKQFKWIN
ncbi:MAG: DinB family protein [Bacteroidales bacterium]|nr:DinB family protein [Bacteroidales bacterium]